MDPVAVGPILINQVYQRIREAIADCTLQPGQRIRQVQLAEGLEVSRQPVSHALHLLKREGLVRESGRKGFEVVPVDPVRTCHLYEVRAGHAGIAARILAGDAVDAERLAREHAFAAGLTTQERMSTMASTAKA
jgi:DNA-binding GntR family transcriptional regulator